MLDIAEHTLIETVAISGVVFLALLAMDLLYVYSTGKVAVLLRQRPNVQYAISAFLGAIPGCQGVYFAISLHTHGLIGFGALIASFIATTGDEAFVMFSMFPEKMLVFTALLFGLGYLVGRGVDFLQQKARLIHGSHCRTKILHPDVKLTVEHYLRDHVWSHLLKKHMSKIFLWTFLVIFIIEVMMSTVHLQQLINSKSYLILVAAALIGLIPQSGPHLVFVKLFADHTIPFSILFTNMFVQSGHALLPLLSISLKDSLFIKLLGLLLGLLIGSILYSSGF